MKLVDSSFLVDYARGDDDAVEYLEAHDEAVIGASTIVLSELYRGLMITQDMSREATTSKYEWVEPVPFTNDAAAEAAEIYVQLRAGGDMINKSDIYIAGSARSVGATLVVSDDDFAAVEGLSVERYSD